MALRYRARGTDVARPGSGRASADPTDRPGSGRASADPSDRLGSGRASADPTDVARTGTAREPLDMRLLVPALVAWAALVALLPRGPWLQAGVAAVCLGGAVVALARGWGAGRWGSWAGAAVLSLAATGLLCSATALHQAQMRAGPVTGWAQERAVTEVEVLVTTEPRLVSRGDERPPLVVLEARVVSARSRGQVSSPRTPVLVLAEAGKGWEDVRWRSRVATAGRWGPADPGERTLAVLAPRGTPELRHEPHAALRGVDHVRDRFRQALAPLPADARGLVPGLVIGDTSSTPPDLTEAMRATGMTHLSAVSGSNVAIIMGGVAVLLARVGAPRRWRTPLVLLSLVGFVLLCRPEPSVMRAGVMGMVGLLAVTSGRRRVSLPALGAAVIGLLCLDPWLARSYGFALSTLATLGLVLWARPWGTAMARHLPRRAGLLAHATAIPLAAQVVCAPVIVLLQGSVTTVAVLANLLSAPLVAPTTILGVVAACLAPVSVRLAGGVAWLAALPAWLIGRIARVCAQLPYGTVDWVDGAAGAWLLTLLTVLVLLTGRWWSHLLGRGPWWLAAALCGLLAGLWPAPSLRAWPPPGWAVVGCDVGQGDAFVVATGPGRAMVVDTGPDPAPVSRCLRDLGVRQVDLLVLTHFHADHVGGLPGVLSRALVGTAYVTPVRDPPEVAERALSQLEAAGVQVHETGAGERVRVGEVLVEVLAPGERPVVGGSAANNGSVVLDVQVQGTRILLTGDLEPEGARPVRDLVHGRDYDVLKVAHHGSAAQDDRLVRDAGAEVALVGVGADNTFGHPSPSALTLLHDSGALVLRTDIHGDIAVSLDDEGRLVTHRRGTARRGARAQGRSTRAGRAESLSWAAQGTPTDVRGVSARRSRRALLSVGHVLRRSPTPSKDGDSRVLVRVRARADRDTHDECSPWGLRPRYSRRSRAPPDAVEAASGRALRAGHGARPGPARDVRSGVSDGASGHGDGTPPAHGAADGARVGPPGYPAAAPR